MRPHVRLAVSGILTQIGTKTFKASSVPILLKITFLRLGYAYCSKVDAYRALYFSLLSPLNLISGNSLETVLIEGVTTGFLLLRADQFLWLKWSL